MHDENEVKQECACGLVQVLRTGSIAGAAALALKAGIPILAGCVSALKSQKASVTAKLRAAKVYRFLLCLNFRFESDHEARAICESAIKPLVDLSNETDDTAANGKLRLLEPSAPVAQQNKAATALEGFCVDDAVNQSRLLHQEGFLETLLAVLRNGCRCGDSDDSGPDSDGLSDVAHFIVTWVGEDYAWDRVLRILNHPEGALSVLAGMARCDYAGQYDSDTFMINY